MALAESHFHQLRAYPTPTHYSISFPLVDRYVARRGYSGTINHFVAIFSISILEKNTYFKWGGHVRVLPEPPHFRDT